LRGLRLWWYGFQKYCIGANAIASTREERVVAGRFLYLTSFLVFLFGLSAQAEVRIFLQDSNGVVWVKYDCTAGEMVRAFALDISVDQGEITGVSGYFRGESRAGATGYGIFPASLRDQLLVGGVTNIDWQASEYTPLASVSDDTEGTLPGLNSFGVTLEFGGLWDSTVPGAVPGSTGTLCALSHSQPANVSISANQSRGGVVSAFPESPITARFEDLLMRPAITSSSVQDGYMNILFGGGELEAATMIDGPWVGTGNFTGFYSEWVGTNQMKFYRVRGP